MRRNVRIAATLAVNLNKVPTLVRNQNEDEGTDNRQTYYYDLCVFAQNVPSLSDIPRSVKLRAYKLLMAVNPAVWPRADTRSR